MVDNRNNQLYIAYRIGDIVSKAIIVIPSGNYNGITFSNALEAAMNSILTPCETPVSITYDTINNKIAIVLTDERDVKEGELEVEILADKYIEAILYSFK